jgi:zinc transporter, ZIP family
MTVNNSPNVGLAFGLVIGAGLATALGAAVVFIPSLVKLASRRVLASALGFSAGVMTYVSFVEIVNPMPQSLQLYVSLVELLSCW